MQHLVALLLSLRFRVEAGIEKVGKLMVVGEVEVIERNLIELVIIHFGRPFLI